MKIALRRVAGIFILFLFSVSPLFTSAADEVPPANVVVAKVTTGTVAPEEEFIGTVYFLEVSDVPAEVSAAVKTIQFEEGQHLKKGAVLVTLDSQLLEKALYAKQASYEEVLTDLERARKDLERTQSLYRKKILSEKDYDDQRFLVKSLEKKSSSLKAEVERLEIELKKTTITTPFDGVVVKKHVARGEWVSPGRPVATVARDNIVDIIVEVPSRIIKYLKVGMAANVRAAGNEFTGTLQAIIPRGDISTRTFPVKIRINNSGMLLEGMDALVKLPRGDKISTLMVPRDAILNLFGKTIVVAVVDSQAKIIPTKVIGYTGTSAAINSKNITEGMNVVVKGNERLRDGQPVTILEEVK